jgi:hypothetical protein
MKDKVEPYIKELRNGKTDAGTASPCYSITNVNIPLGPKKLVAFRCSEKLWEAFKSQTKAEGSSVCHILEGLICAYLYARQNVNISDGKKVEIKELCINREVKRPRRYADTDAHEEEGEEGLDFYDGQIGTWYKVPPERGANEHGHGIGCACSVCRQKI